MTGAASGIGRAIATALAADGATVVVADRDDVGAQRAATDLAGADAAAIDVSDPEACRAMVAGVTERHGRLDILVNGAGFQHVAPLVDFPMERWDAMLATMLTGPFVLIQAALPGMIARGWGRIVNIGSIHSVVASPNKVAYTAAKHGLLGLTRAVALEAGPHGVTCNLVCPAYVRTPLVQAQIADQAEDGGHPGARGRRPDHARGLGDPAPPRGRRSRSVRPVPVLGRGRRDHRVGPDDRRRLDGSLRLPQVASGSVTAWWLAADRSAASTISTAARPSRPVTTGSRSSLIAVGEVLDLGGETVEPVRVEVVAEEVERDLLVGEPPAVAHRRVAPCRSGRPR